MLRLLGFGFGLFLFVLLIVIAAKGSHRSAKDEKKLDFTGVMDSQFSEADTESAMNSQQLELESLKKQMAALSDGIKALKEQNENQTNKITEKLVEEIARAKIDAEIKTPQGQNQQVFAKNEGFYPGGLATDASFQNANTSRLNKTRGIHSVSYRYGKHRSARANFKTPNNYVPSGAFAQAKILGGADADASVDAQSKNNGAMLFKIISPGVLPNGKRSHLTGCIVTASAYGDISSERAYAKLNKISCAFDGMPIIDKSVTGWIYFAGKVGIKGIPLMRDGKVVTWAGMSGALSGIAQAAQYAQSVQNFGMYGGATSIVPSSNIGPFAAYGGASKAADQLSQYYIKRAEQYHPSIQIGSGDVVNIVFKDGFYLDDLEESEHGTSHYSYQKAENKDPIVPQEVLAQLNQAQLGQEIQQPETQSE